MDFELDEQQLAMKKTMRDFAEREIKPRVQDLDQLPSGEDKSKHQWYILGKACELGLMSGFLPRQYGGTLGGVAACIVGDVAVGSVRCMASWR